MATAKGTRKPRIPKQVVIQGVPAPMAGPAVTAARFVTNGEKPPGWCSKYNPVPDREDRRLVEHEWLRPAQLVAAMCPGGIYAGLASRTWDLPQEIHQALAADGREHHLCRSHLTEGLAGQALQFLKHVLEQRVFSSYSHPVEPIYDLDQVYPRNHYKRRMNDEQAYQALSLDVRNMHDKYFAPSRRGLAQNERLVARVCAAIHDELRELLVEHDQAVEATARPLEQAQLREVPQLPAPRKRRAQA